MTKLTFQQIELAAIHRAACQTVAAAACETPIQLTEPEIGGVGSRSVSGAFVTLKRDGRLRSCYGSYGGPFPLSHALHTAGVGAATKDPRFPAIRRDELEQLHVEVSVLFNIQLIKAIRRDRAGEVKIGTHGLTIQQAGRSGLLLPRVAVDMKLDAEAFLHQVSRKAGLPGTAWMEPDAVLQTFQVTCFAGMFAV